MATLKHINIKNVKSINDLDSKTDGQIIVLKGRNGTGKSTLIQSLHALLEGNMDRSLMTIGKDSSSISGIFSVDGKDVTVNISLDTNGKSISILCDGRKIGNTIRSVKDFFKVNTFNFYQKLQLTQQKLKDEFFKALEYTVISDKVRVLQTDLEKLLEERRVLHAPAKEEEVFLKKLFITDEFAKNFSETLSVSKLKADLEKANSNNEEINNINYQLKSVDDNIISLNDKISYSNKEIEDINKEIEDLKEKIKRKKEDIQSFNIKINEAKSSRLNLEKKESVHKKIDTSVIIEKIEAAQEHNENHKKVIAFQKQKEVAKKASDDYSKADGLVWGVRSELNKLISELGLDLSFNENDILCYKNKVLSTETISDGEMINLQVKFDIACNSDLKIMGIYNSNLLDSSSKEKIISDLLSKGYQIFLEEVQDNDELQIEVKDITN